MARDTIGHLRVLLGLNAKGFITGINDAHRRLGTFRRGFAPLGITLRQFGFLLAGGSAAYQFKRFSRNLIDIAEARKKLGEEGARKEAVLLGLAPTPKQLQQLTETGEALRELRQSFRAIGTEILVALTPPIRAVADLLRRWTGNNIDDLQKKVKSLTSVIVEQEAKAAHWRAELEKLGGRKPGFFDPRPAVLLDTAERFVREARADLAETLAKIKAIQGGEAPDLPKDVGKTGAAGLRELGMLGSRGQLISMTGGTIPNVMPVQRNIQSMREALDKLVRLAENAQRNGRGSMVVA
jgi:hypothetical protein